MNQVPINRTAGINALIAAAGHNTLSRPNVLVLHRSCTCVHGKSYFLFYFNWYGTRLTVLSPDTEVIKKKKKKKKEKSGTPEVSSRKPRGYTRFRRIADRPQREARAKERATREEKLKQAAADVKENNLTIKAAAAKHGVVTSTLQTRVSGKVAFGAVPGRHPVLSSVDLAAIARDLSGAQRGGNCLKPAKLRSRMSLLARKKGASFKSKSDRGIASSTVYYVQQRLDDMYPGRFDFRAKPRVTVSDAAS